MCYTAHTGKIRYCCTITTGKRILLSLKSISDETIMLWSHVFRRPLQRERGSNDFGVNASRCSPQISVSTTQMQQHWRSSRLRVFIVSPYCCVESITTIIRTPLNSFPDECHGRSVDGPRSRPTNVTITVIEYVPPSYQIHVWTVSGAHRGTRRVAR